jgi:hypothetical protein
MYVRTVSRTNKDGSRVHYVQIVQKYWDPDKKKARTKVVCSLGRAGVEGDKHLRELVASIRKRLSLEELAGLDGWQFEDSWEHGAFHAVSELWEQLGLRGILELAVKDENRSVPFERAVFAMVANRCLAPSSKLCCYDQWLAEDVYFPEGKELALHHLYRSMDLLDRHKEEIEETLYWKLGDLLHLDVDLVFYDTTSVYFEIDEEDDLRRRGYSKDGRGDRPQVVVGLAVTRDGFPVKSWVFPGNTSDVSTIERVKDDLRGWKLNRCIFVNDAGMSSEENLHILSKGGGHYITAMSCVRGSEVVTEVLGRPGRFSPVAENLEVKEVWVGTGVRKRRYVICRNPLEVKRQSEYRATVLEQLEAELATLKGHPKRACRLFSSRRYGKYLRKLKSGELRIDKSAIRRYAKRDGLWVIRSNDETLSAEDLALAYKQLMRVEECWRTMKSGLELRPMHHRTEERIRAHVYLCVLALLIERVAEKATGETWRTIRNTLRTQKIGQLFTPSGRIYQASDPSHEVCKLYKLLQIKAPKQVLSVE